MTTRWLALIVMAASTAVVAGCQTLGRMGRAEVDPEVLATVRARGEAHVVVALAPPDGYDDAGPDTAERRADIARLQDDVLGSVDPSGFRLRHRFLAVPALAGTVLSENGLQALAAHPRVVRIDPDVGGGAGGGGGDREASAAPSAAVGREHRRSAP